MKDTFLKLEGFAASEYEISLADNAQYDGGCVAGRTIRPRPLYIEYEDMSINSSLFLSMFNPKYAGKLTVTLNDDTKYINYEVAAFNVLQENLNDAPVLQIDLICPDPYFYEVDDFNKNIASRQALWGFPFVQMASVGFVSDYKVFTDQTLILNRGDVETGLIIDFKCNDMVVNPKIELWGTGEYMRIFREMSAGDTIKFETNTARKNIYVNGERYTNFDPGSTFFQLREGENILKYGSDQGYDMLDVYVRYRAKYLGVGRCLT